MREALDNIFHENAEQPLCRPMANLSDAPDPAAARGATYTAKRLNKHIGPNTCPDAQVCVGSEAVLDYFHLVLSIKIQVPLAQELNVMPQETQRPDTSTDSAIRV